SSLDPGKWAFVNGPNPANNELQYYTDLSTNLQVSGGTLKIIARQESYMGYNYTSARIRTRDLFDFRYGKVEVRLKVPAGQGLWPACWMMPTEQWYGIWPTSGEMDIMENLGQQTDVAYGTAHWQATDGTHQYSVASVTTGTPDLAADFHVFTFEWAPGTLTWLLDGVQFHQVTTADVAPAQWPFHRLFHLILNLAVGGDWPGPPDASTPFPATFEVDYVRVYQELPFVRIEGPGIAQSATQQVTFSLPQIAGATYNWTLPASATLVSGQGTHQITTQWSGSGTVQAQMTTTCGTHAYTHGLSFGPNTWENGGFEEGWRYFGLTANAPAAATFHIDSVSVAGGSYCGKVGVSAVSTNVWDVQLARRDVALVSGTTYELTFQARSAVAGADLNVAVIDQSDYTWYAGGTYALSTSWQTFTLTFTAPATATAQVNFDFADETGTFYLDELSFAPQNPLPVAWLEPLRAQRQGTRVVLTWATAAEYEASHFELERSATGGHWAHWRSVPAAGQANRYRVVDADPLQPCTLYRLRQVDRDGTWR
ncbi:MAG: glycosyl hydrolase family protein, partial [Bacteroidetes bacterium]